ncbi:secondary thiamine-phosphate synthase enzyme YjbQ [bacterium]|nr:secondary thiamine-phosphate synthase enzyme YjbQ [bacterium]
METHHQFSIKTSSHSELVSITSQVAKSVRELNLQNGIIHVFVMHTTCGLTINENADPAVAHDLLHRLESLAPWSSSKDRHMEGNSAAHLKSTLLGSSVTIPVSKGNLVLGTWQGLFFGEFDGPRTRTVHLTALHSSIKSVP